MRRNMSYTPVDFTSAKLELGMNRRELMAMLGATVSTRLGNGLVIENLHCGPSGDTSFGTGVDGLDEEIGQIGPGEVLTVAGHPLSGKTSFALTIANHITGFHRQDVIYWGPHIDLDSRLVAALRALGSDREGRLRLRCMHEPLVTREFDSDGLGALIVDDFDEQLSFLDSDWHRNETLVVRKLRELVQFAEDMECLVIAVVTVRVEADWPREPPLPPWHDLLDLGLFGREAQKAGKVAMLSRPRIYLPNCKFLLENTSSVGLLKQCCQPEDCGDPMVILDQQSGLFRAMTKEESRQQCPNKSYYEET